MLRTTVAADQTPSFQFLMRVRDAYPGYLGDDMEEFELTYINPDHFGHWKMHSNGESP
jgi:hypothetical protein